jgi:hypothetical protein
VLRVEVTPFVDPAVAAFVIAEVAIITAMAAVPAFAVTVTDVDNNGAADGFDGDNFRVEIAPAVLPAMATLVIAEVAVITAMAAIPPFAITAIGGGRIIALSFVWVPVAPLVNPAAAVVVVVVVVIVAITIVVVWAVGRSAFGALFYGGIGSDGSSSGCKNVGRNECEFGKRMHFECLQRMNEGCGAVVSGQSPMLFCWM